MKNLYLIFVIFVTASVAFAQQPVSPVTQQKEDVARFVSKDQMGASKDATRGGSQYYWLNFADAADYSIGGTGILTTSILWPDSNVVVSSSPTSGTFHWWQHGYTNTFNPVNSIIRNYLEFELNAINVNDWYTKSHSFLIDSVSFYYYYTRTRNSVDTLKVYTIAPGSSAFKGPYQIANYNNSGNPVRFILTNYDHVNNRPSGSNITEHIILLNQNDTAEGAFRSKSLPINFRIPANASALGGVVGIAFQYVPGHPYSFGDTLLDASGTNPVITNGTNKFYLITYEEVDNERPVTWEVETHYNWGSMATTEVRYETDGIDSSWHGFYVNSLAYTAPFSQEHAYIDWRVKAEGVSFSTNQTPCVNSASTFNDNSNFGPNTWSWNFGDGNTSNSQNPSHTFAAPGTYDVCLTASNGTNNYNYCKTYVVKFCAGIDEAEKGMEVSTYPNPVKDALNIDVKFDRTSNAEIKILNLQGQVIYSEEISNSTKYLTTVDLSKHASGVYMVQITSEGQTLTKKVLLNK